MKNWLGKNLVNAMSVIAFAAILSACGAKPAPIVTPPPPPTNPNPYGGGGGGYAGSLPTCASGGMQMGNALGYLQSPVSGSSIDYRLDVFQVAGMNANGSIGLNYTDFTYILRGAQVNPIVCLQSNGGGQAFYDQMGSLIVQMVARGNYQSNWTYQPNGFGGLSYNMQATIGGRLMQSGIQQGGGRFSGQVYIQVAPPGTQQLGQGIPYSAQ